MLTGEELEQLLEYACDTRCKFPEYVRSIVKDPDAAQYMLEKTYCDKCKLANRLIEGSVNDGKQI